MQGCRRSMRSRTQKDPLGGACNNFVASHSENLKNVQTKVTQFDRNKSFEGRDASVLKTPKEENEVGGCSLHESLPCTRDLKDREENLIESSAGSELLQPSEKGKQQSRHSCKADKLKNLSQDTNVTSSVVNRSIRRSNRLSSKGNDQVTGSKINPNEFQSAEDNNLRKKEQDSELRNNSPIEDPCNSRKKDQNGRRSLRLKHQISVSTKKKESLPVTEAEQGISKKDTGEGKFGHSEDSKSKHSHEKGKAPKDTAGSQLKQRRSTRLKHNQLEVSHPDQKSSEQPEPLPSPVLMQSISNDQAKITSPKSNFSNKRRSARLSRQDKPPQTENRLYETQGPSLHKEQYHSLVEKSNSENSQSIQDLDSLSKDDEAVHRPIKQKTNAGATASEANHIYRRQSTHQSEQYTPTDNRVCEKQVAILSKEKKSRPSASELNESRRRSVRLSRQDGPSSSVDRVYKTHLTSLPKGNLCTPKKKENNKKSQNFEPEDSSSGPNNGPSFPTSGVDCSRRRQSLRLSKNDTSSLNGGVCISQAPTLPKEKLSSPVGILNVQKSQMVQAKEHSNLRSRESSINGRSNSHNQGTPVRSLRSNTSKYSSNQSLSVSDVGLVTPENFTLGATPTHLSKMEGPHDMDNANSLEPSKELHTLKNPAVAQVSKLAKTPNSTAKLSSSKISARTPRIVNVLDRDRRDYKRKGKQICLLIKIKEGRQMSERWESRSYLMKHVPHLVEKFEEQYFQNYPDRVELQKPKKKKQKIKRACAIRKDIENVSGLNLPNNGTAVNEVVQDNKMQVSTLFVSTSSLGSIKHLSTFPRKEHTHLPSLDQNSAPSDPLKSPTDNSGRPWLLNYCLSSIFVGTTQLHEHSSPIDLETLRVVESEHPTEKLKVPKDCTTLESETVVRGDAPKAIKMSRRIKASLSGGLKGRNDQMRMSIDQVHGVEKDRSRNLSLLLGEHPTENSVIQEHFRPSENDEMQTGLNLQLIKESSDGRHNDRAFAQRNTSQSIEDPFPILRQLLDNLVSKIEQWNHCIPLSVSETVADMISRIEENGNDCVLKAVQRDDHFSVAGSETVDNMMSRSKKSGGGYGVKTTQWSDNISVAVSQNGGNGNSCEARTAQWDDRGSFAVSENKPQEFSDLELTFAQRMYRQSSMEIKAPFNGTVTMKQAQTEFSQNQKHVFNAHGKKLSCKEFCKSTKMASFPSQQIAESKPAQMDQAEGQYEEKESFCYDSPRKNSSVKSPDLLESLRSRDCLTRNRVFPASATPTSQPNLIKARSASLPSPRAFTNARARRSKFRLNSIPETATKTRQNERDVFEFQHDAFDEAASQSSVFTPSKQFKPRAKRSTSLTSQHSATRFMRRVISEDVECLSDFPSNVLPIKDLSQEFSVLSIDVAEPKDNLHKEFRFPKRSNKLISQSSPVFEPTKSVCKKNGSENDASFVPSSNSNKPCFPNALYKQYQKHQEAKNGWTSQAEHGTMLPDIQVQAVVWDMLQTVSCGTEDEGNGSCNDVEDTIHPLLGTLAQRDWFLEGSQIPGVPDWPQSQRTQELRGAVFETLVDCLTRVQRTQSFDAAIQQQKKPPLVLVQRALKGVENLRHVEFGETERLRQYIDSAEQWALQACKVLRVDASGEKGAQRLLSLVENELEGRVKWAFFRQTWIRQGKNVESEEHKLATETEKSEDTQSSMSRSCNFCRSKKRKCSREISGCRSCKEESQDCQYPVGAELVNSNGDPVPSEEIGSQISGAGGPIPEADLCHGGDIVANVEQKQNLVQNGCANRMSESDGAMNNQEVDKSVQKQNPPKKDQDEDGEEHDSTSNEGESDEDENNPRIDRSEVSDALIIHGTRKRRRSKGLEGFVCFDMPSSSPTQTQISRNMLERRKKKKKNKKSVSKKIYKKLRRCASRLQSNSHINSQPSEVEKNSAQQKGTVASKQNKRSKGKKRSLPPPAIVAQEKQKVANQGKKKKRVPDPFAATQNMDRRLLKVGADGSIEFQEAELFVHKSSSLANFPTDPLNCMCSLPSVCPSLLGAPTKSVKCWVCNHSFHLDCLSANGVRKAVPFTCPFCLHSAGYPEVPRDSLASCNLQIQGFPEIGQIESLYFEAQNLPVGGIDAVFLLKNLLHQIREWQAKFDGLLTDLLRLKAPCACLPVGSPTAKIKCALMHSLDDRDLKKETALLRQAHELLSTCLQLRINLATESKALRHILWKLGASLVSPHSVVLESPSAEQLNLPMPNLHFAPAPKDPSYLFAEHTNPFALPPRPVNWRAPVTLLKTVLSVGADLGLRKSGCGTFRALAYLLQRAQNLMHDSCAVVVPEGKEERRLSRMTTLWQRHREILVDFRGEYGMFCIVSTLMAKELRGAVENPDKYCLCHGQDGGFMVCCDGCEVWFHGECIGVQEPKPPSTRKKTEAADDDSKHKTKRKRELGDGEEFLCFNCCCERNREYKFKWPSKQLSTKTRIRGVDEDSFGDSLPSTPKEMKFNSRSKKAGKEKTVSQGGQRLNCMKPGKKIFTKKRQREPKKKVERKLQPAIHYPADPGQCAGFERRIIHDNNGLISSFKDSGKKPQKAKGLGKTGVDAHVLVANLIEKHCGFKVNPYSDEDEQMPASLTTQEGIPGVPSQEAGESTSSWPTDSRYGNQNNRIPHFSVYHRNTVSSPPRTIHSYYEGGSIRDSQKRVLS